MTSRSSTSPFPVDIRAPSAVSQLYLAYSRLFDYPGDGLADAFASGDVASELATLHQAVGVGEPAVDVHDTARLEQSYISLFEIGTPESAAPLYESAYQRLEGEDRRSVLEDLVRFYEFFDLDLGERPSEQPDHLTVELEFMAVLAQMEAQSATPAGAARPFRLAQRDFLVKHLRPFVTAVGRRLTEQTVYAGLLTGLSTLLSSELRRLEDLCGPAGPTPSDAAEIAFGSIATGNAY